MKGRGVYNWRLNKLITIYQKSKYVDAVGAKVKDAKLLGISFGD